MVALNPAPLITDVHPFLEIGLGLIMILFCMLIHSIGMYQVMHRFEIHWWRFAREIVNCAVRSTSSIWSS
jgi:hypothetical protein